MKKYSVLLIALLVSLSCGLLVPNAVGPTAIAADDCGPPPCSNPDYNCAVDNCCVPDPVFCQGLGGFRRLTVWGEQGSCDWCYTSSSCSFSCIPL